MLVGIHQPHYLPWLRYIEKIARCDVFIVLDNIQFNKNGWQNRNKIKTLQGATLLTVPVHAPIGVNLDSVQIAAPFDWRKRHWRTIEQNYRRAPHFSRYAESLEAMYAQSWSSLVELNMRMLENFVAALGIKTRVVRSSELDVPGTANDRLINLVRAVNGSRYYSGAYALEVYLDPVQFAEAGIAIEFQKWTCPVYAQLHGEFIPDLAVVDLLMNCGPKSLAVLMERT